VTTKSVSRFAGAVATALVFCGVSPVVLIGQSQGAPPAPSQFFAIRDARIVVAPGRVIE